MYTEKTVWTQAWLTYTPRARIAENEALLASIGFEGFSIESPVIHSAVEELRKGICGMWGLEIPVVTAFEAASLRVVKDGTIGSESYALGEENGKLTLQAGGESGVLYGIFRLLRGIAFEQPLQGLREEFTPDCPLRMLNHWDNLDGSIERGYSGNSFFFAENEILVNERTVDYARLASSVGINAAVINNVNVKQAASWLITGRYFEKLAALSGVFARYGIKLYLSLNFAASIEVGGLDSADPLSPTVISWWEEKMAEVFANIPNLGGFLVKADSEGRPGPFTYGRTQADGANMLADIVKKYDALIIWRCFVYNCTQDWRDYVTDRARAGYDNFITMDGDYHDNVILQIKNGPMDFQIREPVSPLLGGLQKTHQLLEVQAAQEYTGHQIDLCYLIPMFREVLDFRTCRSAENDRVRDLITARTAHTDRTGFAAVSNTGDDENWTGSDLAAANFYGFGRLAMDTGLSSEKIAEEWIRMTYGNDPVVVRTLLAILLPSRRIYENYTSPLGIGWMVTPNTHYGCSVDGYEYSRWGTYHRADHYGIGVDRSHNGTGYAQQYFEPNASMYDSIETCPEELLLFFHHVPYTHRLKSGQTLIQYIYDSHFEGTAQVGELIALWNTLEGRLPERTFRNGCERFALQLENAKDWRDQVNSYFYRKSAIPDEKGRTIY